MVDINIDIQKLRALPLRLKVIAGVVAFDIAILLAGYMLLDDVMADRVAAVEQVKGQLTQAKRQNADLRRQLDEYPMMRQRYDQAMASGMATSLDRLKIVQSAQSEAAERHLADLHYRLADEAGERDHSAKYRVEMDRLVFENGGLLDSDAIAFWNTLLDQAKGHYRLVEASLERTQDITPAVLAAIRRGDSVSVLKAKLDLQWVGIQPQGQETK